MPRVIRRNAYHQDSKLYRCRIMVYREYGLSFRDIALQTDWNPTTVLGIGINGLLRGILNGMMELNSLLWLTPESADILYGRPCNIVRPHHGLTTIYSQCLHRIQYMLLRCDAVSRSMDCHNGDHLFCFSWQCNIDRNSNSDNKVAYRSGTMHSFQTNLGSAHSNLMAVNASVSFKENARRLSAFDISIGLCT